MFTLLRTAKDQSLLDSCIGLYDTIEDANHALTHHPDFQFMEVVEIVERLEPIGQQYACFANEYYINAMDPTHTYKFPEGEIDETSDGNNILIDVNLLGEPIVVPRVESDKDQFLIKYYFLVDEPRVELKAVRLFHDNMEYVWNKIRDTYITSGLFLTELNYIEIGLDLDNNDPHLYLVRKSEPLVRYRITKSADGYGLMRLKLSKYKSSLPLRSEYEDFLDYWLSEGI
jgi:hypothetical protein